MTKVIRKYYYNGVEYKIKFPLALITTPGIYHDEVNGLISLSSDGSTRYTIADKNLGATIVYNDGDTVTNANGGYYFQWGNNYGFAGIEGPEPTTSSTKVNVNNYGPGNYYSGSTYITASSGTYDWANPQNNNLWGDTTDTLEARQGPCSVGFHVPTVSDWTNVMSIISWSYASIRNYLKIPFLGIRNNTAGAIALTTQLWYWTSTIAGYNARYMYSNGSNSTTVNGNTYRARGLPIRPFKNTPVQPDETWTVLYQPS